MKKIKTKILSTMLVICLMVGMLPVANITAYAEETGTSPLPTMAMGMSGIGNVDKNNVTNSDQIVMGTYDFDGAETTHSPTNAYWVRLNDSGLMFAVQSVGESAFEASGNGYYPNSTLNTAMTTLYDTGLGLTDAEKTAISSTTLSKGSMHSSVTADLTGQHFFPLSNEEFNNSVGKGSKLANDSSISWWWLRSSSNDLTTHASFILTGNINYDRINNSSGVRPAFNLNTSSVLFTSAAENGKTALESGHAPTLSTTSGTVPTKWKMTLLDSTRSSFSVTGTPTVSGKEVTFDYTGATIGANEYISVMITTGTAPNETITHYAKVAQPTTAGGSATFTIPSNIVGVVNLKIFNEQANGDNNTDYSSAFEEFAVTIPSDVSYSLTNITSSNNSATHDIATDYTATLSANTNYILPQTITVSVNDTTLTSGYTYTQSTGELTIPSGSITGDIEITAVAFSPVTDIIMTNASTVHVGQNLTLSGTVSPSDATNQDIEWSVSTANTLSGVSVTNGVFTASTAGKAQVTATIANGATATTSFSKDFEITVTPVPTYGISLTPSADHIFPSATVGYGEQTAHGVTVTNTGNVPTGELKISLSGTNKDDFTLDKTTVTSIGNDSATFTVTPNTGLAVGTYTATVTVSGSNGISNSFNVSFTVDSAPAPTPIIKFDALNDLTHKLNLDFDMLEKIIFNGTELELVKIDNNTYELKGYPKGSSTIIGKAERGSVVVTLYNDFLATLAGGNYLFEVIGTTGSDIPFENMIVSVASTPTPTTTPHVTPQTGDDFSLVLWISVAIISFGAAGFIIRKKRNY